MRKSTGMYPAVRVDAAGKKIVSQAGAALLDETVRKTGLDRALSGALSSWMKPMAIHDPGKTITDLALSAAIGGDRLADVAQLRAELAVFGRVTSDPTVSRLVDTLAEVDRPGCGGGCQSWEG